MLRSALLMPRSTHTIGQRRRVMDSRTRTLLPDCAAASQLDVLLKAVYLQYTEVSYCYTSEKARNGPHDTGS